MQHSWLLCFAIAPLLTACVSDQSFHMDQDVPAPIEEDTAPPIEPPADVPVAVCSVSPNPVTPPFEEATWDGSESYDDNGFEITEYRWSLVEKPEGSAVQLPPAQGDGAIRGGFIPDLAGDYVGQLIVTNSNGDVSEPCEVTLESIPAEDLWVEMYWSEPQDDMDLHLVRPGGQYENQQDDCYYQNCVGGGPDWGVRNDAKDDPSLDLDDIPGTGPENINILMPESGEFTVYVHDYRGSTPDYQGTNQVTVNVYLNGSQVWTNTKPISGDDTVTPFCRIDWANGTVDTM